MATQDLHGRKFQCVLKDWVCNLPMRQQGTLLTGIRGCDVTAKYPLDSMARTFTAFIRNAIMNAFDYREIDSAPGCFMQTKLPKNWKASGFGHEPNHWIMHIVHCLQIIGLYSDEPEIKKQAGEAYLKFVSSFHFNPETFKEMENRLNEDRIAKGNIVE